MSFKVKSLLVWLLATLVATVVLVPQQAAASSSSNDEESACEADVTCSECFSIGDTFNQAYEECYDALDSAHYCTSSMFKACCQHKVSESDCLLNEPFLALWWSYLDSCPDAFPSVETCASAGVVVTSGGSTGTSDTPAPSASAAATATTPSPAAAAPVATPTTPVTSAAAPTLAPLAAAPVETLTTAPAPAAAAPTAPTTVEAAEVTTVTVSANAYDARTDESGCAPDGCTPELTRDGDLTDLSRWSCSAGLVEAGGGVAGEECQIVYDFSEAQVVHSVAISFYKGDTRTRSLNINVNGDIHSVIESSGTTAGLETFELEAAASSSSGAQSVLSLGLESVGLTTDEFLSIIEVEFHVSDAVASPSAAAPLTPAPVEAVSVSPVADAVTPAPTATATSANTVPPNATTTSDTTVPTTATTTSTTTVPTTTTTTSSSATTIPSSSSGASPAPVTTDRVLDFTPSPIDTSTLPVGNGTSSDDTATITDDISVVGSSSDVCSVSVGCYDDDECLQCITNDQDTSEWEDCIAEEAQDSCRAVFSVFCCSAALSGNDCMANDLFNAIIECLVVDLDPCSVDEDWTCSAAGDTQVTDNSAGTVAVTPISYSRGLVSFTLGLAVVIGTML